MPWLLSTNIFFRIATKICSLTQKMEYLNGGYAFTVSHSQRSEKKCTQLHKDFWTKLWNISNKTVSGAHCIWASKHFPLVYFFLYLFPFFVDVSYWILMGWNITQMLIILLHPFIFVFYNAGSSDVNRKKRQLIIHIWSIFWTCSANIWFFLTGLFHTCMNN